LNKIAMPKAQQLTGSQQTSAEPSLSPKFGIKGGFDLTSLYISDVSSEHMKPGFDAGIYAKLPVTRGFSIQPELLYSAGVDVYIGLASKSKACSPVEQALFIAKTVRRL
jgi:hypothetical protein